MYNTIQELEELLDINKPLYVDTETAESIKGSGNYDVWVVTTVYQEHWGLPLALLMDSDKVEYIHDFMVSPMYLAYVLGKVSFMVGQNLIYDIGVFKKNSPIHTSPSMWGDTLHGYRLQHPEWGNGLSVKGNTPFMLSNIAKKVMGANSPYIGMDKATMQKAFSVDTLPTARMIEYAKADVAVLPELWRGVEHWQHHERYKLSIAVAKTTLTHFTGLPIDLTEVELYRHKQSKSYDDNMKKIRVVTNPSFNVGSWMQVRQALGLQFHSDELTLKFIAFKPDGIMGYNHTDYEFRKFIEAALNDAILDSSKKPKKPKMLPKKLGSYDILSSISDSWELANGDGYYAESQHELPSQTPVFDRKKIKLIVETHFHIKWFEGLQFNPSMLYGAGIKTQAVEPNYIHSEAKSALASTLIKGKKVKTLLAFHPRVDRNLKYGLIHSNYTGEAKTGRATPKDDNITQYPRVMKKIWGISDGQRDIDPDNDVLVYADFSTIELRTICTLVGVASMYHKFQAGIDIHSDTAEMLKACMPKVQVHYIETTLGVAIRQIAKVLNFLLLYGGGIRNLQRTILMRLDVWVDWDIMVSLVDAWKAEYPEIVAWQKSNGGASGTVYSLLGKPLSPSNYTERNNLLNQASAAEVALKALVYMVEAYDSNIELQATMLAFVHDSTLTKCSIGSYKSVALTVLESMERGWKEITTLGHYPDLVMPIDVFVGKNWGTIEDDYIYKLSKDVRGNIAVSHGRT